jgi:hypothetical protein
MPLLQTPGPAPEFTANAFVNGSIGNVALKDYRVSVLVERERERDRERERERGGGRQIDRQIYR